MFEVVEKSVKSYSKGKPGQRFRARYRSRSRERSSPIDPRRILRWVAGLACFAIGGVLTIFPGPAILFFLLGGGLLASESWWVARSLDGVERWLQPWMQRASRRWKRLSPLQRKVAATTMALTSLGLLVAGTWMALA